MRLLRTLIIYGKILKMRSDGGFNKTSQVKLLIT